MFDQPRNMWQSPKFREHVGSYIFERLARAGLVVTIHDFKHEAPLKKFAEAQGDFGVPVRFPVHIITILSISYFINKNVPLQLTIKCAMLLDGMNKPNASKFAIFLE